ncbi:MAG: sulfite exporter TauE/SafE family protein [Colwellia sp.]|nr:sulfite exporter TauE/SafE family protein [Colwellia sp.]
MIELILIACVAVLIGLSLGMLGSGGAILTVPALIYIVGQDEKIAIASSLAIVGLIAFTGAVKYQQHKMIHWPVVWQFGFPSMLGSYVAAGFSVYLSGVQQLILFAVIMILAALSMLKNKTDVSHQIIAFSFSIRLMVIGLAVGCVSGLVGVGGGFLIVPALLAFTGVTMTKAVATSLVIITLQSLTGFIKYYSIADQQALIFDWQAIAVVALVGAISSILGQKISTGISQDKLKKLFALFLLIMSIFILTKSTIDLLY